MQTWYIMFLLQISRKHSHLILEHAFSITSTTTQISPLYSSTVQTTALYIITRSCTVAPVCFRTVATTPHCRCTFIILLHRAAHFLLWKVTVQNNYGKDFVVSSGSKLTQIDTLLSWKQCFRVSRLRYIFSLIRKCYVMQCRLLRSQWGTWCPQLSQWEKIEGCYSRIRRLFLQ